MRLEVGGNRDKGKGKGETEIQNMKFYFFSHFPYPVSLFINLHPSRIRSIRFHPPSYIFSPNLGTYLDLGFSLNLVVLVVFGFP